MAAQPNSAVPGQPLAEPAAVTEPSDARVGTELGEKAKGTGPTVPPEAVKSRLGERPAVFGSTLQEVLFVSQATAATMTTSFLAGTTMIITASIGRDLAMTQGEITWIGASTSLTAGAFQLPLGQLADLVGRKPTFLAGMGSFGLVAAGAGFARMPLAMDALCGLLGVCAALSVPPAAGLLGAAYEAPSRRKNLAFSAFSAGNPLGFVLGSLLCGAAARLAGWRAAFWLLAILWALLTLVGVWAVPAGLEARDAAAGPPRPGARARRLRAFAATFDFVGAALVLCGTGMFSAAITLGPADGWVSGHVLGMLVAGLLLLVVFVFWERTYSHPLMPPRIWKDRNFSLISVVTILGFMSFTSASFWLAFFFQEVLDLPPLDVAVRLLPQAIAGLTWNVVAGILLHRVNNALIMAAAALCYVASMALLSLMRPDSSYWAYSFPYLVLSVVGADFQFNVANMYVMQSLPSHQQSLAGGIFNTMIRLCSTVSLGITTAVFSSVAASPAGAADPMLKFTRAWQVSLAMAGASLLFVPFIRLGTQGNSAVPGTPPGRAVGDLKGEEA